MSSRMAKGLSVPSAMEIFLGTVANWYQECARKRCKH